MPRAPSIGPASLGLLRKGLKVCVGGGVGGLGGEWKNLLLAGSACLQVMPEEEWLLRGRLPRMRVE